LIVAAAAALVGAGATISSASSGHAKKSLAGGTYRVGWESSFNFTDGFDPTGEYLGDAIGIMQNVLIRGLVNYNHVAGAAGNVVVPDLATALPKPTNGGKTYTFHLKSGIKYGPPVNREITSKDVAYALNRMANPKNGAQYAFYFDGTIAGWHDVATGKKKSVSGIKTPNAKTIVVNLTRPTGDFLQRMSLPATFPIPPEVGKCFEGKPGGYGRDLISSGPYMIEGSDSADASSCAKLKPFSGFDAQTKLTLVRNPNYKASTDTKKARENLPDRFEWTVNANPDDIANRIKSGDLEDNDVAPAAKTIREYLTSGDLKPRIHFNSGDQTYYVTLNLTQPPFDDIHNRKAMNLIVDKDGLRRAWGGPVVGAIATHIVPDTLEGNYAKGFDPYKTPGWHGSQSKAAAEVKKSKYDPGHTGKCSAKECKGVLLIADQRSVDQKMVPLIQANAAKIGITFDVRTVNGAYPVIQTPAKNVPISERPRWGKDYADALTFFQALFTGSAIIKAGNTNYSLVGITPKIAASVGAKGNVSNVPSIDKDFGKCSVMSGTPRVKCWAALDKKLMTQVVPWVPYMWAFQIHTLGPKVTKWNFDQSAATTAYAHVAVKS